MQFQGGWEQKTGWLPISWSVPLEARHLPVSPVLSLEQLPQDPVKAPGSLPWLEGLDAGLSCWSVSTFPGTLDLRKRANNEKDGQG